VNPQSSTRTETTTAERDRLGIGSWSERSSSRGKRPQRSSVPDTGQRGGKKALDGLEVTRPIACRLLGLTARRFARLEASGVFVASVPGSGQRGARYDAAALILAFLEHSTKAVGADQSPRDRHYRAGAELTELRIARERGLLLPRDEVVETGCKYIGAVQARLRAIVPRLRQDTSVDEPIAMKVTELLEEAIEEMAGWRSLLALLESEDA
jgi:hypothetical protein